MAKIGWGRILAGVATVAAAGAAYVYFRQRAAKAPVYEVLQSEGSYEVRRYPYLRVLSVEQPGTRDRALGTGFGRLASYMFGEGRDGEELPITMPLIAASQGERSWRISFLLPEDSEADALAPPGDAMVIGTIPARVVAVLSVPGKPADRLFKARAADLQRWAEGRGLNAAGPIEHAYYTSPLKPGKQRASEIWLPLSA